MRLALGAGLLLAAMACGGGGDATGTTTKGTVKFVQMESKGLTVQAGETSALVVTARDSVGTTIVGRAVTWTSRDAAVATVSQTGTLTAVAIGSTYVLATIDGKPDSTLINVITKVGFVVVLPQATTTLIPNRLQYSVLLQDANHVAIPGTVLGGTTWSVSDITKATISATGLLQSVGVGNLVVTARFQSGSFPAFTSTTTAFIVMRVGERSGSN